MQGTSRRSSSRPDWQRQGKGSRVGERSSNAQAQAEPSRDASAERLVAWAAEPCAEAGGAEAGPAPGTPEQFWFPFHDFVHSYSETPKVPPIGFHGPRFSPFGPASLDTRPWTGGAPTPAIKKERRIRTQDLNREVAEPSPVPPSYPDIEDDWTPEFGDTAELDDHSTRSVDGAQGPLAPADPEEAMRRREEVLGDPLTAAEVESLVLHSIKERRQVNLGRDGVVHNMLELIHTHWRRRPVCKVRCKGVPTVDMENVVRTIEERTGGVVIHRSGGVLHVFRGRYYDHKTRPRIPLMLWKPPAPVYPYLIQEAPDGLTKDEANELRVIGRRIRPICRLVKNGVYLDLVDHVRDTLQKHPLCKVDCRGLERSDLKKIGAKLRDLVPCVLLSFERDQILMLRPLSEETSVGELLAQVSRPKGGDENIESSQGETSVASSEQEGIYSMRTECLHEDDG